MNGESTLFLNQTEAKYVTRILNHKKINYQKYYPYPESEKVIIYQDEKPTIKLLEIKSKKELKHSDILGSLFGENITYNNYEIIIKGGHYYIIVLNKLLPFFLTQFRKVGKYNIELEEVDLKLIDDYKIEYLEVRILCSSLRLDNVISSITKLSRKAVNEFILDNNVLVNYENVKRFKNLEIGDILSIRRYGKYKFKQILGTNKKGKIIIELLKYK